MNPENDIFSASRPKTNEKPDVPQDDIFFSSRPKNVQKQFKQPISREEEFQQKLEQTAKKQPVGTYGFSTPEERKKAGHAITSGLTFGASNYLSDIPENEKDTIYKLQESIGSFAPITGLYNFIGKPLVNLAAKSPIAKKALTSIASMAGWGASGVTEHAIKEGIQGKMPTAEDLLVHGVEWAAFDGILQSLFKTGKLAKGAWESWVNKTAEATGKPSWQVASDFMNDLRKSGIDMSKEAASELRDNRVVSEFMKIAEQPPIELTKNTPTQLSETGFPEPNRFKKGEFPQNPPPEPRLQFEYQTGEPPTKDLQGRNISKKSETPPSNDVKTNIELPLPQQAETNLANRKITTGKEPPPQGSREIPLPETQESTIDLANRHIEQKRFKVIDQNANRVAEPIQPNRIDAETAIENIQRSSVENSLDSISKRSPNKQTLGTSIQHDIEQQFKKLQEVYEPLYNDVEGASKNIKYKSKTAVNTIERILKNINKLKTRPEGYKQVITVLNDVLHDLGYNIGEIKGQFFVQGPKGWKGMFQNATIPLSKTIELGRRLNKIADYDIVGSSIKNNIKKVTRAVKAEIKQTLENFDPELAKKFAEAERLYGETADKYATKFMKRLRGMKQSEKVAAFIDQPTILQHLKNTTSPEQYAQIERELLQSILESPHKKASEILRETGQHLSKESQNIAKRIVAEKAPHARGQMPAKIKNSIIDDLNYSFNTGQRPAKTMQLWQTKKGQSLIRQAVEDNPNKKEILDYLRRQSVEDLSATVLEKNGQINFKKLHDLMSDPSMIDNIRQIGGPDAVAFFRGLEHQSKQLQNSIKLIEKIPGIEFKNGKIEYPGLTQPKTTHLLERAKRQNLERAKTKPKEAAYVAERLQTENINIEKGGKNKPEPEKITHGKGKSMLREASEREQARLSQTTRETALGKETGLIKPGQTEPEKGYLNAPRGKGKLKEAGRQEQARIEEKAKPSPIQQIAKESETAKPTGTKEDADYLKAPKGKSKLRQAARKAAPLKFKLEDLCDKFGITPTTKQILSMLGVFGLPKTTAAYIGAKIIWNWAKKPRSRKAVLAMIAQAKKAAHKPHDLTPYISSLLALNEAMDDIEED